MVNYHLKVILFYIISLGPTPCSVSSSRWSVRADSDGSKSVRENVIRSDRVLSDGTPEPTPFLGTAAPTISAFPTISPAPFTEADLCYACNETTLRVDPNKYEVITLGGYFVYCSDIDRWGTSTGRFSRELNPGYCDVIQEKVVANKECTCVKADTATFSPASTPKPIPPDTFQPTKTSRSEGNSFFLGRIPPENTFDLIMWTNIIYSMFWIF